MSTVIGIDPGVSGAFVAVTLGALAPRVLDMPTIKVANKHRIDGYEIRDWLIDIGPVEQVWIEEVAARPGAGVSGMFNFGLGAGTIHGILIALERPWTTVKPARWTRDLGVGADKGRHREEAQRLFPTVSDLFARVKDDGRADAALIAVWGQHQIGDRLQSRWCAE